MNHISTGANSTALNATTYILNQSFSATDTLILKIKTNAGATTVYLDEVVIEGYKNKSSDTTWVSVS